MTTRESKTEGKKILTRFLYWTSLLALLSQLPAGYFHITLGKLVYFKDILAILSISIVVSYMFVERKFLYDFSKVSILFLYFIALFSICSFWPNAFTSSILVLKWVLLWVLAYSYGWSINGVGKRDHVCAIYILIIYVLLEVLIGMWEIRNQEFFFAGELDNDNQTLAGVDLIRNNTLDGFVRVRGLQRSVFQFSNNMAIACIVSIWFSLKIPNLGYRIILLGIAGVSFYTCYMSGGRTGLLGICFGIIGITLGLLEPKGWRFTYLACSLLSLFIVGLIITIIGPVNCFEFAQGLLPGGGSIQMESSFIREENWSNIFLKVSSSWSWLYFGSIFTPHVALSGQGINIIDNQYLWCLYHLGIFGCILVLFFSSTVLTEVIRKSTDTKLIGLFIGLFGLCVGESIGRDSIFINSMLVLMVLVGFFFNKKEFRIS